MLKWIKNIFKKSSKEIEDYHYTKRFIRENFKEGQKEKALEMVDNISNIKKLYYAHLQKCISEGLRKIEEKPDA